ncbi:hypothetical protein D3C87_1537580 [compost metagenome]
MPFRPPLSPPPMTPPLAPPMTPPDRPLAATPPTAASAPEVRPPRLGFMKPPAAPPPIPPPMPPVKREKKFLTPLTRVEPIPESTPALMSGVPIRMVLVKESPAGAFVPPPALTSMLCTAGA